MLRFARTTYYWDLTVLGLAFLFWTMRRGRGQRKDQDPRARPGASRREREIRKGKRCRANSRGLAGGTQLSCASVRPSAGPGEEVPGSAPLPDTRPLSCFTGVPQEEREDRKGSREGRAAEMLKPRKSRPRTRFYSSFNQPGTSAFEPSRPASTPGRVRPADNPVMAA